MKQMRDEEERKVGFVCVDGGDKRRKETGKERGM